MRQTPTNDDVISTREAAERLGVALRTVQLWVESGVLPAWKTAGGHRRIARSAVDTLLAERRAAINLPARGRPAAMGAPAPSERPAERGFRMLVVEDEPDLLRLFTLMIEGWELPIALTTAGNGFEALLRIGEQRPDLLVTDLNMPGMDGFRMIRSLRAAGSGFADLEVVVVTALGAQDIEDRGGLPEGVRVFTKPVPFSELERLVRQRLGRRRAA